MMYHLSYQTLNLEGGGFKLTPYPSISWFLSTPAEFGGGFIPNRSTTDMEGCEMQTPCPFYCG